MSFLEKISGRLYPVVLGGVVLGFGWNAVRWLERRSHLDVTVVPREMGLVAAVIAVCLFIVLLEKIMPLLALSELRWVYRERPYNRMRSWDADSVLQLISTAAFGLIVGASVGQPLLAVLALGARVAWGMRRKASLATLLQAGRTRTIGLASLHVQDNELASDALAATWVSWRTPARGPLVVRRFLPVAARRTALYDGHCHRQRVRPSGTPRLRARLDRARSGSVSVR
ncbi:hypothetical protein [Corynebacterium hindlerae]|uniref:hypothetical protein n=1 Tax=Corynebacterium hindlerae TaxID=699041 RepID=UPI003AAD38F5